MLPVAVVVKRLFGHVTQTDPLTYAYASMRDQSNQVSQINRQGTKSQEPGAGDQISCQRQLRNARENFPEAVQQVNARISYTTKVISLLHSKQ